MKNPKASILVVEDDPAILQGLLDVLTFNGYQAAGAADGGLGRQMALSTPYDLILLDVMLPTTDGLTICREVRRKKPGQGIIILTAKGAEDDVIRGFRAGADDYVAKPFSLRELMVRVEAVLRRAGKTAGDQQVQIGEIFFDGKNLSAVCRGRSEVLTRREMEIICYLHRHRDRIVSKKELLTEVWHYADAEIETRTVDIHILKLRKKIGALGAKPSFLQTIRGEGYRLETTS